MLPEECPAGYEIISVLGKGSYGLVFKALHKETAQIRALKRLPGQELNSYLREVEGLASISSKHAVKCLEHCSTRQWLWLAIEYCAGGSLSDIMQATETCFSEREIAAAMRQLLTVLVLLHGQQRVHRDVKAGNLLLGQDGLLKLADFGVARVLEGDGQGTKVGSPFWMSPEVLSESPYSTAADIWSVGITAI
jgi:serine/threonine protein kinase